MSLMGDTTIYRTEPMATRALGAEIRHDHRRFVQLLERVSDKSFGDLLSVQCEVKHNIEGQARRTVRVDVELEFAGDTVGVEAKLDHELTRRQIDEQVAALKQPATLVVLLPRKESAPRWLAEYPDVAVIDWAEALACFDQPRLTMADIEGEGRLMKTTVESWLDALDLGKRLPGWFVEVRRGGSGMPSVVFESPAFADGRNIRGQVQVAGRAMKGSLEEVRFNSFIGVAVDHEDEQDFPDPSVDERVPGWIDHLSQLHSAVLDGQGDRLGLSRGAAGRSEKKLGVHKLPLAKLHLGQLSYLAKGYADWAVGPKTTEVSRSGLDQLADNTVEICTRWYEAVSAGRGA